MDKLILLSGCSGGGKSTLLAELAVRGFHICEEPGRRIVGEEMARGGTALPWIDMEGFALRAARMAIADLEKAAGRGDITVFDRGLVDAVCALQRIGATLPPDVAAAFAAQRYAKTVFLAPPWPEIFVTDSERQHRFEDASAEYDDLARCLPLLGHTPILLPKVSVSARADFVQAALARL